jgi:putative transposase
LVPKFPRLVVPGYPHHVTQRGVRRQQTFFDDTDYRAYIELIKELKLVAGVEIWAYCLMPNHVHLIAVPKAEHGLAALFGTAHHRYAKRVNAIHDWRGHLWQERFYSVAMNESHSLAAMRYVELNPVRAGLCKRADEWPWSSVHRNLGNKSDKMIDDSEVRNIVSDWGLFLAEDEKSGFIDSLRNQTNTGRPSGDDLFIDVLERKTGRRIRRCKPGPPVPKR